MTYAFDKLEDDFSQALPMAALNGWSSEFASDGHHIHKKEIGIISLSIETDEAEKRFIGTIEYGNHKILVSRRPLTDKWVRQSDICTEIEIPQTMKTKKDLARYLEDLASKIEIFGYTADLLPEK